MRNWNKKPEASKAAAQSIHKNLQNKIKKQEKNHLQEAHLKRKKVKNTKSQRKVSLEVKVEVLRKRGIKKNLKKDIGLHRKALQIQGKDRPASNLGSQKGQLIRPKVMFLDMRITCKIDWETFW